MTPYSPGPVNRIRGWLTPIAVLVVIAACILVSVWYLSRYEVASVFTHVNTSLDYPYVTPYGAPYGGPTPTPPIADPEQHGITAGPDGAL
jgi:hypothetical protein